jgi:hypothetical protein
MAIADPNRKGPSARVTGIFDRLRTGVRAGPGRGTDTPDPGPRGRLRGPGGIDGGPLAWSVPAVGVIAAAVILLLGLG